MNNEKIVADLVEKIKDIEKIEAELGLEKQTTAI